MIALTRRAFTWYGKPYEAGQKIDLAGVHPEKVDQLFRFRYILPPEDVQLPSIAQCETCERVFKNREGLKVHQARMHK